MFCRAKLSSLRCPHKCLTVAFFILQINRERYPWLVFISHTFAAKMHNNFAPVGVPEAGIKISQSVNDSMGKMQVKHAIFRIQSIHSSCERAKDQ